MLNKYLKIIGFHDDLVNKVRQELEECEGWGHESQNNFTGKMIEVSSEKLPRRIYQWMTES